MSVPIPFDYEGRPVRTVVIEGEPWWVAADVCAILGYSRVGDALRMLDTDDLGTHLVRSPDEQVRPAQVVSEPGLYSLILRSKRREAKDFKRWVTHEVIPQIRKTGHYELPASQGPALPDLSTFEGQLSVIDMLRDQVERRQAAELEAAGLRPSAEAWDVLGSTDGDFSVREAAYILNRDPGIDTGQNRLFALLRGMKVIDSRNRPYAAHSSHVRLRPQSYRDQETGEQVPAEPQVRITIEGLR